jgi:aspartyl aminopeptidase
MSTEPSIMFANHFVQFMNEGCSAFHAVEACQSRLKAEGFTKISEKSEWALEKGGKYYFTRNETSLMAFTVGEQFTSADGCFTAVGAHTDSPCLRIKAVSAFKKGKFLMLNTQPYGGGLWHTWFDRDLGLAGRAIVKGADGSISSQLFRIDEPIARIVSATELCAEFRVTLGCAQRALLSEPNLRRAPLLC